MYIVILTDASLIKYTYKPLVIQFPGQAVFMIPSIPKKAERNPIDKNF